MEYFIIYSDTESTQVEKFKTVKELKEKISELDKDKWIWIDHVIKGKELIENI